MMKKTIFVLTLLLMLSRFVSAQTAGNVYPELPLPDGKSFGVINVSVASHHAAADTEAPLETQTQMGTVVKVSRLKRWYYVEAPDSSGWQWVNTRAVQLMDSAEVASWNKAEKVIVLASSGTVYSTPNVKSQPVSDMVAADRFLYLGRVGKFFHVGYPDGREGYVLRRLAAKESVWRKNVKCDAESIIATAMNLVGIPYRWGGASTKSFDCSGFVQHVFRMHGIELMRNSRNQAKMGCRVDFTSDCSNLRPGDLVFFGRKATDGCAERTTHVGIYIGDGKYIHCQDDVHINSFYPDDSLFDENLLNKALFARRILK